MRHTTTWRPLSPSSPSAAAASVAAAVALHYLSSPALSTCVKVTKPGGVASLLIPRYFAKLTILLSRPPAHAVLPTHRYPQIFIRQVAASYRKSDAE